MADYSGDWSCPDCPANGTHYSRGREHDPWCPTFLKAAQDAAARKKREDEDARMRQAWIDYYRTLDADVFMEQFDEADAEAGRRYGAYRDVQQQLELMRDVLRMDSTLHSKWFKRRHAAAECTMYKDASDG